MVNEWSEHLLWRRWYWKLWYLDGENDEPIDDNAPVKLLELLWHRMSQRNKFKITAYEFYKFFLDQDTPLTKHF